MFSKSQLRDTIKSMSLVFGDIGTIPIYTLPVIFLLTKPTEASIIYIPFHILSIVATFIGSQSMISGVFSIVYQGITTRIMPMLKIDGCSLSQYYT
jgi:K+ transporter